MCLAKKNRGGTEGGPLTVGTLKRGNLSTLIALRFAQLGFPARSWLWDGFRAVLCLQVWRGYRTGYLVPLVAMKSMSGLCAVHGHTFTVTFNYAVCNLIY